MRHTRIQGRQVGVAFVALVCAIAACPRPAFADPTGCQRAIAKAASTFVQQRTRAFADCAEKKLAGKLAANQDCGVEPKTQGRVLAADIKLRGTIAKACGGKNKACNAADSGEDADESLAAIGWDVGTCPGFVGAGCANPIDDCADVATCLECVASAAGDQMLALAFDHAAPSAPRDALNKCQLAIAAQSVDFFVATAKALGKCEEAVLKGTAPGPCPAPGDGKAEPAIAKAKAKKSQAICKACGGSDKACGGGDDRAVSEIGFGACPSLVLPATPSCGGQVETLTGIVHCTDCVTNFQQTCLDALALPGLKFYPSQCGAQPTPTPTATPTPTVTVTPTATVTPPPSASSLKCQRTIVKESSRLGIAAVKALQKCEAKKLAGSLPGSTDCETDAVTAARLAKADTKLRAAIAKACGGGDKTCDPLDTGGEADEPLGSIGWQLGQCPDLRGAGCANPLVDCGDVGACLGCALRVSSEESIALYYDALVPGSPGSDLAKCQAAIGAAATKFVSAKLKALAKCEDAILAGKTAGPCPDPGDGKASTTITKAVDKMTAAICQACGGPDRACGGGDDQTVGAIGFASTCPAVAIPGGAACGAPVSSLDDLVACVYCLSEANVDCADFLTVPGLKPYPAECGVNPTPTPTPTSTPGGGGGPTPTPTVTPGSGAICGNGAQEAGEFCDDGNTANCDSCPANCQAPPGECSSVQATRHTQQVSVVGPTELGAVVMCLSYPGASVGFPGTSTVGGRLSGFAGSSNVVDFNNAAQIALLPAGSQSQFTFTLSFDRCTGAPVPDVVEFSCITKDASDTFGNELDPPTIVECTPVAP